MTIAYPRGWLAWWIALLWEAMSRTGNGYRRPPLGHTGQGTDRRDDKREGEPSLYRKARMGLLTRRH